MSGSEPQQRAGQLAQFASADELQGYLSKTGVLEQPEAVKQVIVKIEEDFKFQEARVEHIEKLGTSLLMASGTFLSIFLVALAKMREQPDWDSVHIVAGVGLNHVLGLLFVVGIIAAMLFSMLVLRVRRVGRLSAHWLGPLFADNGHFVEKPEGGATVLTFEKLSLRGQVYIMRNKYMQFLQYHELNKKRTKTLVWAQWLLFASALVMAVMVVMFIIQ